MKGGTQDLIDQVQMMLRRIEHLEESSQARATANSMTTLEPLHAEIALLKSKLVQERQAKDELARKKNREVAYFKDELETMLDAMQRTMKQ